MQLRKVLKNRGHFPSDEASREATKNMRIVHFEQAILTTSSDFPNTFPTDIHKCLSNQSLSCRERIEATTPVTKLKLAWARFGGQRFGLVLR